MDYDLLYSVDWKKDYILHIYRYESVACKRINIWASRKKRIHQKVGKTPAFFNGENMKELSVFVDEFGALESRIIMCLIILFLWCLIMKSLIYSKMLNLNLYT